VLHSEHERGLRLHTDPKHKNDGVIAPGYAALAAVAVASFLACWSAGAFAQSSRREVARSKSVAMLVSLHADYGAYPEGKALFRQACRA
jgi:hypothetical protein